jgi:hypothetical protein
MRVKFTKDAVAAGRVLVPGEVAELPEELARYYLAEGSAEATDDPVTVHKPKPAK